MRNLGLDLLRLTAIVLVIGRHLQLPGDASTFLQIWKRGGWVGVDLFFVLSGFLVSSLLFGEYLKHGRVDFKRFLIRRGFKIYPAFWLFLIPSLIAIPLVSDQVSPTSWEIAGEFLFLQNYLGSVWGHTWSLAVEEHFYIGLAIVFFALTRSPGVRTQGQGAADRNPFACIPALFVAIATICLGLRLANLYLFPAYSVERYLYPTHLRIDSLAFGVLIAYGMYFWDLKGRISNVPGWLLLSVGAGLLAPAFVYEQEQYPWMSIVGVTAFYLGSGLLVLGALRLEKSSSLVLQGCGALGTASYSIYLWHMLVETWGYTAVKRITGVDHFYLYLFVALFGAIGFGWVLNRVIEAPVLWFRDWAFPAVGARKKDSLASPRLEPGMAGNLNSVSGTVAS